MHKFYAIGAALLLISLGLVSCSGRAPEPTPKHAAYLYVIDDVSRSARVQSDDAFGKAVRARAAEAVTRLRLGDRIQLFEAGSLSSDRLATYPPIKTGYHVSLAQAQRVLFGQLEEVAVKTRATGGDGSTNIIATLENIHPDCRSGRTEIEIDSDGVEASASADAGAALAAGKPVVLPKPATAYLHGCHVTFIGFGVVSNGSKAGGQLLPAAQLNALRQGWTNYLKSAGVTEVTFTSLI